jgi:hypothetical protein
MARTSLSLPHERRKAQLQSVRLRERVRIAEAKERLKRATDELRAMQGKATPAPNR